MKIKKIISLIIVLAISITGFSVINNNGYNASAATVSSGSLWDINSGNATLTAEGEYTKLSFETDKYAEYDHSLALENFEAVIKFSVTTDFTEFSLKFTSNAPEKADTDEVVNTLTFSKDAEAFKAKLNDNDAVTLTAVISEELTIKLENDVFTVNTDVIGTIDEVEDYVADLQIINEGENAVSLLIASINTQKMKLDDSLNILVDDTYIDQKPTIIFNTIMDGDFYIPLGLVYKMDYVGYDVLSSTVTTELLYKKHSEDDESYKVATNNKIAIIALEDPIGDIYDLKFTATDNNSNKEEIIKQITVKTDSSAPVISSTFGFDAYMLTVENAVYKEGTTDYLAMGSGEYYYIPSFDGMFDDISSYSDMKYNMIYNTPTVANKSLTNVSSTSLKIELTAEGKYSFKISAVDQKGNISDYSNIFEFEIYNSYAPVITAPTSNDNGYVGTEYAANSFTIKGVSTSPVYTLYYLNGSSWEQADEELSSLTFTPDKSGQYKIECNVTDRYLRTSTADTIIIVEEKTATIKGDTEWVKNNIWSIVFLCTGTLSLIGIIVLLLIKPKQEEIIEVVNKEKKSKDKKKN